MSELPNESTVPSGEPAPDYPDTEQPDAATPAEPEPQPNPEPEAE